MKIKNIVFSGFAAVIFANVCGVANAASVNLASKSYVDDGLATKADLIDLENLQTTVGQKATQEALNTVATQVNTNTTDIADLKSGKADKTELNGLVTSEELDSLRTALEAEIANKQAAGEYAQAETLRNVANELSTLKNDVYTKAEVDQKITDVLSGGQIELSGYATSSALDALTALVNGNTTEITTLKNEVNAKQDKLTAGTGIEITDNTISANIDTSAFVPSPTVVPTTYGEYVLMLSIGEDGKPEGYDWLDTLDLMGNSGFDM